MAFFLFTSCSFFIEKFIGEQSYEVVGLKQKKLSLVFSHNLHGETHPCGCRHFPLGGLAQVAGQITKLEKDSDVIYVDTGDTFFDSLSIPETLAQSRAYNAQGLALGLSKVGLKYWVPGDNDFAKDVSFLKELVAKADFTILLSNLKKKDLLPHKEFALIERGPHKIFLLGMIHPSLVPNPFKKNFAAPREFMPTMLKLLKEKGFDSKNVFHRLVLLSHSGKELDDKTAEQFPQISWIIGAHTQNFYRSAQLVNKTQIVQVLSRNHYLGNITFDLTKDRTQDSYLVHEIRDELKDELKPNPLLSFIDKHKQELKKIQLKEQEMMTTGDTNLKYTTSKGCMECHDKQVDWWQGTSHSLAYTTLIKENQNLNLDCVKCHSLGQGHVKGFNRVKDIIEIDESQLKNNKEEDLKKKYWAEVEKAFAPIKSVRKLTSKQRKQYAKQWVDLDNKHHINRNFANVQCMNCHINHDNHPWEELSPEPSYQEKVTQMQNKCLSCHNSDQSPEWYNKLPNGAPGAIDQGILQKKFKEIACPKTAN